MVRWGGGSSKSQMIHAPGEVSNMKSIEDLSRKLEKSAGRKSGREDGWRSSRVDLCTSEARRFN
jgi:hypothetical protein